MLNLGYIRTINKFLTKTYYIKIVLKNYLVFFIFSFSILLYGCSSSDKKSETNQSITQQEQPTISADSTGKNPEVKQATVENEVLIENKEPEKAEPEKEKAEKLKKVEPTKTETPVVKPIDETIEKFKKPANNNCPETMKPFLVFEEKYGLMSCEMNPENTAYHYFLVISKNKNFSSSNIVKSFDLNFNSVFPVTAEQKDQLKKIKEFANLYFRYEIYCDKTKYVSQIEGPLSISCRDSGECQIMR